MLINQFGTVIKFFALLSSILDLNIPCVAVESDTIDGFEAHASKVVEDQDISTIPEELAQALISELLSSTSGLDIGIKKAPASEKGSSLSEEVVRILESDTDTVSLEEDRSARGVPLKMTHDSVNDGNIIVAVSSTGDITDLNVDWKGFDDTVESIASRSEASAANENEDNSVEPQIYGASLGSDAQQDSKLQSMPESANADAIEESVNSGLNDESLNSGLNDESLNSGLTHESQNSGLTAESINSGLTDESLNSGLTDESLNSGLTDESLNSGPVHHRANGGITDNRESDGGDPEEGESTLPRVGSKHTTVNVHQVVAVHAAHNLPPTSAEDNKPSKIASKDKDSNIWMRILSVELEENPQSCFEARGILRPLFNGSKYLVDVAGHYTFQTGMKICAENDLILAELDGMADHQSLQEFVSKYKRFQKGSNDKFLIGTNDIKTEGVYKRGNGKPVIFQNFHPSEPDDKNQTEDCVAIFKETALGPVGSADVDCDSPMHLLCMFRVNSQCYNESKETIENRKVSEHPDLKLMVNASERAYFVSNFQASWKDAMNYCIERKMRGFSMDRVVTMGFFKLLARWQADFAQVPIPIVQYWTSGKFKASHMTAPIIWHTKPVITASEERGVEKHNGTFSWSGMYHWSSKKPKDPGGPHGYRRDLCVSFGFDNLPDGNPFIRNTNCELPSYFVCYEDYESDIEHDR